MKNFWFSFIIVILVISSPFQLSANPFSDAPLTINQTSEQPSVIQTETPSETTEEADDVVTVSPEPTVKPVKKDPDPGIAISVEQPPLAAVTSAASAPEESLSKILPGFEDENINIDGDNYCGQFAMSSVFKGLGMDKDPQQVYKDTNPRGIFTAPPIIADYLNKNGVPARQLNGASVDDIIKKIDSGKPVILLVNSSGGVPHWINVYGYKLNADGSVKSLVMRDSYWGTSGAHEMEINEFKEKWRSPFGDTIAATATEYRNVMIDIGNDKPRAPFATATEDNIASGINNVVTGFTNRDWGQVAGGATKLLSGLPAAVIGLASKFTGTFGERISAWGSERWNRGGLGNRIAGGAAVVGGKAVEAVSWVGKTVGNGLSSLSSAVGNGINRLFGR